MKMQLHSDEAEQSVLGGLMLDNETFEEIDNQITENNFYQPKHKLIFRAISDLYLKKQSFDIVTVTNHLKEIGKLDYVGGEAYIYEIAHTTPSIKNILSYAKIVSEYAQRRELIRLSQETIDEAKNSNTEPAKIADVIKLKLNDFNGIQNLCGEDWEDPILFDEIEAPEISASLLPPELGDFAAALAKTSETAESLPVLVILGVVASIISRCYVVSPKDGWCENTNLYVIVGSPPATNKSLILRSCVAPQALWEKEERESLEPQIKRQVSERKTNEKRLVTKICG